MIIDKSFFITFDVSINRFSDLTGIDYSEWAISLARSLANRDEFIGIKLLVDDVLDFLFTHI